ncbi:MAG: MnhB domain-containing protein, partial [Gammaproteobacteria bacterium]
HVTPGGGFAGGVVIACGFILLTLAGGERQGLSYFPRRAASVLDSVGVLVFLAIAYMGMWWAGGVFFRNFIATSEQGWFTLFSGGVIPLANIGLGLKVASSLFLVFTVLAAFRLLSGSEDTEGEDT